MRISGTDIYMTRGDSESISVKVSGYTLQSGDSIEMTVRERVYSPVVFHKKITEFSDNTAVILIDPSDTEKLQFRDYIYDIQLNYGGAVKTIVKPSKFSIGKEVTYGNLG